MPKITDTKKRIYVGIDPGKSGGIASLYDGNPLYSAMPKSEYGLFDAFRRINTCASQLGCNVVATLEKVHSLPRDGHVGAFTFGQSYGSLRMALVALGIPFETVSPQTWQKMLGIPKRTPRESHRDFKHRLKAKAEELFPGKKLTLATCDALLLAKVCSMRFWS